MAFHITDHQKEKEEAIFQSLRAQPLQGLIYFVDPDSSPEIGAKLKQLQVPVVLLGGDGKEFQQFQDFDRVYCHEEDMARELVRMMRHSGFSRLICFLMPEEKEYQKRRNEFLRSALEAQDTPIEEVFFMQAREVSSPEGYRLMSLLPKKEEPTSICLLSNLFTGGVLRFLRERGALCEAGRGAFQVFTLGDSSMFQELGLGYPYVSLPVEELAEKAAETLLKRIQQRNSEISVLRIPPFLSTL